MSNPATAGATITVEAQCPLCSKVNQLTVNKERFTRWQQASMGDNLRFVQNAFPELNADQREFLISGCCPDGFCFNAAFAD